MTTLHKRPVYLNLVQIKLPIAGIMSIGHRISGVLMSLSLPLWIYLLDLSLSGQQGFEQAQAITGHWFVQLIIFGLGWGLVHHLLAGIRYLLIDVDVGVDKPYYRQTAVLVTFAAPVLTLLIWVLS